MMYQTELFHIKKEADAILDAIQDIASSRKVSENIAAKAVEIAIIKRTIKKELQS